jgi:hypothetical protein
MDQKSAMSHAVTRREVEESVMKWNINMLDTTFGPSLRDEIGCNKDM